MNIKTSNWKKFEDLSMMHFFATECIAEAEHQKLQTDPQTHNLEAEYDLN